MRQAIVNCVDTGPLESLVVMLRAASYQVYLMDDSLRDGLTQLGCDTVLSVAQLAGQGYEPPMPLPYAGLSDMDTCDLYVDIKAWRNGPKVWERWPRLRTRTLTYRINGGEPEITKQGGDERNLENPILTCNQWYKDPGPWEGKAYVCWTPFRQWDEYKDRTWPSEDSPLPVCLVHNVKGWGHQDIADLIGPKVRMFGTHDNKDGLVNHSEVPDILAATRCMVHLKSNDCPGFALYEACAARCPVIVSRRMIWRMRMQDWWEEHETCLCFDGPGHHHRTKNETWKCSEEILNAISALVDPDVNRAIGDAGHDRLKELLWSTERDGEHFKAWMEAQF